ncbi:MAG: DUF4358 domain-containing protein [Eubacterium sp.]|nr:DUF4358 domain-containing protein [Eubacterium sp.]
MDERKEGFDIAAAPVFTALKIVALVLMVIFIISEYSFDRESKAAFEDVSKAVSERFSQKNVITGDNQMIKRLYGIDPNEYSDVLLYYPSTNMGSEELLLVKLNDLSQQETVKKAMEERVDSQKNVFEGYAPDQVAMLEKAKVDVEGNYILMVSAENPDEIVSDFLKAIK